MNIYYVDVRNVGKVGETFWVFFGYAGSDSKCAWKQ